MEIRQEIKRRAADIEARIAPFLPQEKGFQQTVLDAMEYSVFAGGKRLRPMLMEASYQMFDGTNPAIDDFMAAIEMISIRIPPIFHPGSVQALPFLSYPKTGRLL